MARRYDCHDTNRPEAWFADDEGEGTDRQAGQQEIAVAVGLHAQPRNTRHADGGPRDRLGTTNPGNGTVHRPGTIPSSADAGLGQLPGPQR